MKILVLSYSLASGGAEHFAVDLCNTLSADHEVTLLTTDDDAVASNCHYLEELRPEVRYVNLHCRSGRSPEALFRISRYIGKTHPDIVHANTDLIQLLLPLALHRKPKYVHTIHNLAEVYEVSPVFKPLFRHLYRRRVCPVTISRQCSASYRKLYGLENDVTLVNGRTKPPCSDVFAAVREQLRRFRAGRPLFVHVSRYARQKNQEVLFAAFREIENACLVVLGRDFPPALTAAQDASKVLFVGECPNVGDYLAEADFFVLSSLYEGLPLALLEAMSYGVTPVSTPAGGVCDVIRDAGNGYLSAGFDAPALAAALRRALAAPVDRQLLEEEYRRLYSMEACAGRYLALFARLAA